MNRIVICVGIPGSGKSTFTNNFIKKHPSFYRVSRDEIRKAYTGLNNNDFKTSDKHDEIKRMVIDVETYSLNLLFTHKKDIIVDNTNSKKNELENIINLGIKNNYQITIYFFDTDFLVSKERIKKRDKTDNLFFMYKYKKRMLTISNYLSSKVLINNGKICIKKII